MKNPWVAVGILAVVLVGGSIAYAQYVGSKANEGVEVREHVKGNPDADVVLVEYSDFECPACAAFHPTVSEIMDVYGDQVRFEYRHFPVINRNPQVLVAAEAAGQQGKFFEYHDLLFENQEDWLTLPNVDRLLEQYAQELDLDMDLWTQHRRASLLRSKIQEDFNRGRTDGVTGTPTFFLNDERVEIQTFGDLIEAVEEALGVEQGIGAGQAMEISPEDLDVVDDDGEAIELELGEPGTGEESDATLELEL